ncbi:HEXXH motif-containing putative peptide modification protein [Streptomyces sp. ST1015]|uniref:aKG-HExxH-type peptide beta-hydroxylase n=1 Tax=unclassified Streptomyces TaxID=2593676 RepID=UPI000DD6C822|nr:HEXXH motif-containing putative peptide modification protein [Streptomyces sp. ST1015]QZZ30154.1 HEXXH motif domain-containing protein [Streptomyces sp. ST1015]
MTLSDTAIADLGRTGADPETLGLLVRDQHRRQLLVVRAVLDAAGDQLRDAWDLLTQADRAASARVAGPEHAVTPVRARLLHPLTGSWAWHTLRNPGQPQALGHLEAIAAACAVRAGLDFTLRISAYDGMLVLPSLGALRTEGEVEVAYRNGRMTSRQHGELDVTVHPEPDVGAWSASGAWLPAYALPGLVPGAPLVPLEDLDPYRATRSPRGRVGLGEAVVLDDTGRKRWAQVWSGAGEALRTGGEHRVREALTLLRCLVPLTAPPDISAARGTSSATRREAFGALLSSIPPGPVSFASTIVHELHHAKLSALSDVVTLHQASGEERYFAPWRQDPRPFEGLLQGAYSHLAIADYQQRLALTDPAHRERAWTEHARCHAMVGAALPALVGSPDLTVRGRLFVDAMADTHERMREHPAPRGQQARAQAYVHAARTLWTQRHASAHGRPNE